MKTKKLQNRLLYYLKRLRQDTRKYDAFGALVSGSKPISTLFYDVTTKRYFSNSIVTYQELSKEFKCSRQYVWEIISRVKALLPAEMKEYLEDLDKE